MEPTQNNTPQETTSTPSDSQPNTRLSGTTIAVITIVILGLLGAGYAYMRAQEPGAPLSFGNLFGGDTEQSGGPVARVNGETITREAYNEAFDGLRANLEAQGVDLSNEELQTQMRQQVINSLVENELLRQAAVAGNFSATEADVQGEYDALATQLGGADVLMSQMASVGLTDEALRDDIQDQLTIRSYLLANIDESSLTVSEEEITAYYNEVAALGSEDVPPLKDVRDQIAQQLRLEKEQLAVTALIATLRADAEVEILL